MEPRKTYQKPQITRIKLSAGEAIMTDCQSVTQRNNLIKNSTTKTCRAAAGTNCRNQIS